MPEVNIHKKGVMMLSLTIRQKNRKGEEISVNLERGLIIGRGKLVDIDLGDDKLVSRLHAIVVPRPDGKLEVRDLSSKLGTFVIRGGNNHRLMPRAHENGHVAGRALLSIGEKFFLGNYEFEFCCDETLGEPTMGLIDEEDEITGIAEIDYLK